MPRVSSSGSTSARFSTPESKRLSSKRPVGSRGVWQSMQPLTWRTRYSPRARVRRHADRRACRHRGQQPQAAAARAAPLRNASARRSSPCAAARAPASQRRTHPASTAGTAVKPGLLSCGAGAWTMHARYAPGCLPRSPAARATGTRAASSGRAASGTPSAARRSRSRAAAWHVAKSPVGRLAARLRRIDAEDLRRS